ERAVLPMPSRCRNLSYVDLWIEVGRKGLPVATAVYIDNVQLVDFVEDVLCQVGCVDICNAGIESTPEKCHNASFLELLPVRPLPMVLEFGSILRLVIRRIQIIGSSLQAGVHNRQVLVGQGDIDD